MATGDIHTSKQGDKWVNKVEGNQRASNTAPTKAEAQATGKDMAIERGVEHYVHEQGRHDRRAQHLPGDRRFPWEGARSKPSSRVMPKQISDWPMGDYSVVEGSLCNKVCSCCGSHAQPRHRSAPRNPRVLRARTAGRRPALRG